MKMSCLASVHANHASVADINPVVWQIPPPPFFFFYLDICLHFMHSLYPFSSVAHAYTFPGDILRVPASSCHAVVYEIYFAIYVASALRM